MKLAEALSLRATTLRRIEAGLKKFGGANAEPFLIAQRHMANAEGDGRGCRSLDGPTPTVTIMRSIAPVRPSYRITWRVGTVSDLRFALSLRGRSGGRTR